MSVTVFCAVNQSATLSVTMSIPLSVTLCLSLCLVTVLHFNVLHDYFEDMSKAKHLNPSICKIGLENFWDFGLMDEFSLQINCAATIEKQPTKLMSLESKLEIWHGACSKKMFFLLTSYKSQQQGTLCLSTKIQFCVLMLHLSTNSRLLFTVQNVKLTFADSSNKWQLVAVASLGNNWPRS